MDNVQKILSVSMELFKQYGFKTITMEDIARRAGLSKKTLYQHFATKNDVVIAGMDWYNNLICDRCEIIEADSDNAIEAMVRTMAFIDSIFQSINPLALLELQRHFPEAHDRFREEPMERTIESIRGNIERGMEEGYYRERLNADLLARYRMESCMFRLQPGFAMKSTRDIQRAGYELDEHYLYGLMTPKGERLYIKYKEKYLKEATANL